ncbi:MAG: UDP-N-acetylglucosamine--N-acetylmuramyl-(pentapeptide) pyrophosphoryl-undecaprenol N-acetylglucosamine transferase, partial [Chloroflexota bacterium]
ELGNIDTALEVLWIGTEGEMEEVLVPREGYRLVTVSGGGIHGVGIGASLKNMTKLYQGWRKVRSVIDQFNPDAAFFTGGYSNGPVALAAWEKRVPRILYLPDIEPGFAVRWLSKIANVIACTAEESLAYLPENKCRVTGYPIRPQFESVPDPAAARQELGLESDLFTLLVFGGSRGARNINRALQSTLAELLSSMQIIHISGNLDWPQVDAYAQELEHEHLDRYHLFPYLHDEMPLAFSAADLVVSRAGAATLGEYPFFGLPAVLVPYPYAWRYQQVNADYLAQKGAAVRLDDAEMDISLAALILELAQDPKRLTEMSQAMRASGKADAALRIAEIIMSAAGGD